eukprot:jgi/Antlo1/68/1261
MATTVWQKGPAVREEGSVFDANTSKSVNTLASELTSHLAAHGVGRLLVASILCGVQDKWQAALRGARGS